MQLQYSNAHSRTQSVSQSHNSFPGTTSTTAPGHRYSQSFQSSVGSPVTGFNGPAELDFGSMVTSESPLQRLMMNGVGAGTTGAAAATAMGVGLGIASFPAPSSTEAVSFPIHVSFDFLIFNLFILDLSPGTLVSIPK